MALLQCLTRLSCPFRKLDFNPRSEVDVEVVYHEKMEARRIALKKPLETGLPFTLDLEVLPHNPDARSRPLAFIPRTDSDPGTGVVLRLHEVLQPGVSAFSQVWTANVIIQPSLLRLPSDWANEYYDPWDVAHNEAWAYQKLVRHQGLLIPYFFGVFEIVAPCGELAWVLVPEFVPGLTVNDVNESTSKADTHYFCALGVDACRCCARFCSQWLESQRHLGSQPHPRRRTGCMDSRHNRSLPRAALWIIRPRTRRRNRSAAVLF
ncbi:hypothetical protein C8J57DRAFT_1277351 [Mycena rebaudengoi]|nr:hypothetical protein C8J57DRAFT_1277351 [Mycena rebaudengoi]